MDCKTCKESRAVVPYIVHESAMARQERTIKRLVIALIVAIVLAFVTNLAWVWYINQYDFQDYEYTYSQDGEGVNIIGDSNGVDYDVPKVDSASPNP